MGEYAILRSYSLEVLESVGVKSEVEFLPAGRNFIGEGCDGRFDERYERKDGREEIRVSRGASVERPAAIGQ